jgi:L-alanine-DL-glutamate epimerase-like enolase superfamily enzyme
MAIKAVSSVLLNLPYDIGGPKQEFLGHTRTHMQMLLVRVESSGGIVGWGEAFSLGASPATQCAIEKILGPYMIGQDENNFQQILEDLRRKLQLFGRGGLLTFAISGLDIALWDIAGKKAGRPIGDLLGAVKHTSLPAYASLMKYGTPELLDSACRRAVTKGYKAIKIHEHKVDRAAIARQVLGNQIDLMVDVNCAWDLEETLGYLPQLEELKLRWLEEPVWPPETARNLRVVKSKTSIPLAGGENVGSSFAILDLAESQALDLVQPSITKIGGISEMARIASELKNSRPQLVPHSPYFGPGFLATLHIASTLAFETPIEKYFCDFCASPLGDLIEPKAGRIGVPTAPGIGGEPDPNVIREFQVQST